MGDGTLGSWTAEMSGRERVRAVAEILDGPSPVDEIANRAEVSRATAADELERLATENVVKEVPVNGKKGYDLNPAKLFFDEVLSLIEEHQRSELEATLETLQTELETLQEAVETTSLPELRNRLSEMDATADEIRELREVIATWEALETELTVVRTAHRLYRDVTDLSRSDSKRTGAYS